jgi:hypothetical protein
VAGVRRLLPDIDARVEAIYADDAFADVTESDRCSGTREETHSSAAADGPRPWTSPGRLSN